MLQAEKICRTWLHASPGLLSTAMLSRATKKCWWTGAYSPGAITVPYFLVSPGGKAPRLRIPVILTSASIFPSCHQHHQPLSARLTGNTYPLFALNSHPKTNPFNNCEQSIFLDIWHPTHNCIHLVKMPKEAIFIVGNCAEKGCGQASRTPYFSETRTPVLVFPQYPKVLFM